MEKLLDTPARIYYKYEGVSPAGSHKPNTAVPQVWYNAQQGVKNVVTETGAGQWGSSLAFACSLFGLNCEVMSLALSYLVVLVIVEVRLFIGRLMDHMLFLVVDVLICGAI